MKYEIEAIEASRARVQERFVYLKGFYGDGYRGGILIQHVDGRILGEVTWYDDRRLRNAIKAECRDKSWQTYWENAAQVGQTVEVSR